MTHSLRVSPTGLEIVDRARKRRGWTKTSTARWWQDAHTSRATLRRFWQQERIQRDIFIAICESVGIPQWEQIADPETLIDADTAETPDATVPAPLFDLDEAPNLEDFYGRSPELDQLTEWVLTDTCKLIAITGLGGIGKTALAVALVDHCIHHVKPHPHSKTTSSFDFILWRSLQTTPSLLSLLHSLLHILAPTYRVENVQDSITHLVQCLRKQRCLIVLDGLDAVFSHHPGSRQNAEDYCHFLQQLSKPALLDRFGKIHPSCLVFTSREQPPGLDWGKSARLLKLKGLSQVNAVEFLRTQGYHGEDSELAALNQLYDGNPLALKLTISLIRTLFRGNVATYLAQNTRVIRDPLRMLLQSQLDRLSDLEREIAYWFAIWQQPISLCRLQTHLFYPSNPADILESLAQLEARSLLEKCYATAEPLLTLSPLVLQTVQELVVSQSADEIMAFIHTGELSVFQLLRSHCLLRPGTDDLAGDKILTQLRDKLLSTLTPESLQLLSQHCFILNDQPPFVIGYAAYNLSALLSLLAGVL